MSVESVLNNDQVKSLVDKLNLKAPTEKLIATKYSFVDGNIVISNINVVTIKGEFLRKANLKKVLPYLKDMHIEFKNE